MPDLLALTHDELLSYAEYHPLQSQWSTYQLLCGFDAQDTDCWYVDLGGEA